MNEEKSKICDKKEQKVAKFSEECTFDSFTRLGENKQLPSKQKCCRIFIAKQHKKKKENSLTSPSLFLREVAHLEEKERESEIKSKSVLAEEEEGRKLMFF